nr:DUF3606 domain-containing protein [Bradyrhizobium liaoningense]
MHLNPAGRCPNNRGQLCVTREELQKAVDKVGNSAATVRKELGKEVDAQ